MELTFQYRSEYDMSLKDRTKLLLAEAIKDLAKSKDLSEIRVSEICRRCNVDRHTFYYHFQDKYDLVAWIYAYMTENSIRQSLGFMGPEESVLSMEMLQQDIVFYQKAFQDASQNPLWKYILEYNIELYEGMLKQSMHVSELSEDIRFSVRYHCYGCLGLSYDWIMQGATSSPKDLVSKMIEHMPPVLKQVVLSYGSEKGE